MSLFDEPTEADLRPKQRTESTDDFYRRSTRPQAVRVRSFINGAFDRYPAAEQETLRRRCRDAPDEALFELFMHELLLRLGHTIELHPAVPGTTRRPDFLAAVDGLETYVEATVTTGESDGDAQERRAHDLVLDTLDEFDDPNFFFGIAEISGIPQGTPSRARLRELLQQCVLGLDPDDVAGRIVSIEDYPRHCLEFAGLAIEIFAIPKSANVRGRAGLRAIGIGATRGGIIRNREALRSALKRKGRAYGTPDRPLIIAINATMEMGIETVDVQEALYGDEAIHLPTDGGDPFPVFCRNGLWTGANEPTYTRISAVLVGMPVLPGGLGTAELVLYQNPWATQPYIGPLTRLTRAVLEGNRIRVIRGESVAEVLGLPTTWPHEDA